MLRALCSVMRSVRAPVRALSRSIRAPGATKARVAAPVMASVRAFGGGGGSFLPREEIEPRVLEVIKHFREVDPSKVDMESDFVRDLGLDSLDTVELVLALEDEFNIEIPEQDAEKITKASEAISYISQTPFAK